MHILICRVFKTSHPSTHLIESNTVRFTRIRINISTFPMSSIFPILELCVNHVLVLQIVFQLVVFQLCFSFVNYVSIIFWFCKLCVNYVYDFPRLAAAKSVAKSLAPTFCQIGSKCSPGWWWWDDERMMMMMKEGGDF